MRTSRTRIPVFLCGAAVLFARTAAAQTEPKPAEEVVPMENTAGSAPAAAAPAAAPAEGALPGPAAPSAPSSYVSPGSVGGPAVSSKDWGFDFHGYFRAPLRLGLGHNDNPAQGQGSSTIHQPVVPDDQYLGWAYTGVQSKDWAEAFFSYGNSQVKGTIGLLGFNFTDAAYQQGNAQYGIGQGWLTLTPSLGYKNVRFEAKVGSFWSKYGMAGRYDAGKYDTFLFGRTHLMGETVRMEIDLGKLTLWAEQGFGGKQPDPSIFNTAKFSLVIHEHAGIRFNKWLDIGLHTLYSWTAEEDLVNTGGNPKTPSSNAPANIGLPDGKLSVTGLDVKLQSPLLGYLYLGYSHIGATNAETVDDGIEVLHSGGGGEFGLGVKGNYLDSPSAKSGGNGHINTFLAQYELSLASLLGEVNNKPYWGEGPDLTAALFMMYNKVQSDDQTLTPGGVPYVDGIHKLKWGADLLAIPLKWLGVGARFDRVQPNSNIPEQSFSILSPRIVFKTAWLTHEEVMVQYSRYSYNQRACGTAPTADKNLCVQPPSAPSLPNGFGAQQPANDSNTRGAASLRPDVNVVKLQATMWW